jgi:2-dehydro-3-deoxyphosphogluconate aldolase/(4S)-4-hydroxy-2-oxoglutarate aldolase
MLAAGGTTLENFIPFLRAGCVGVGLGPAIADPALAAAGKFAEITARAEAFVHRLREARAIGQVAAAA